MSAMGERIMSVVQSIQVHDRDLRKSKSLFRKMTVRKMRSSQGNIYVCNLQLLCEYFS